MREKKTNWTSFLQTEYKKKCVWIRRKRAKSVLFWVIIFLFFCQAMHFYAPVSGVDKNYGKLYPCLSLLKYNQIYRLNFMDVIEMFPIHYQISQLKWNYKFILEFYKIKNDILFDIILWLWKAYLPIRVLLWIEVSHYDTQLIEILCIILMQLICAVAFDETHVFFHLINS